MSDKVGYSKSAWVISCEHRGLSKRDDYYLIRLSNDIKIKRKLPIKPGTNMKYIEGLVAWTEVR